MASLFFDRCLFPIIDQKRNSGAMRSAVLCLGVSALAR